MVLLSACGTTERTQADPHDPTHFIELVQQTYQADYEPFDTPAALVADTDIEVTGVVASVTDGSVEETDVGPLHHVQIGITPAGSSSQASTVYVELPRPENWEIKKYADELPVGSRIALMGYLPERAPKDKPFYVPAPQGLFVESVDGTLICVLDNIDNIDTFGPGWSSTRTMDDLGKVIGASAAAQK